MSSPHHQDEAPRKYDAVHLPGGQLRPEHWTALAALAAEHRADVQLAPRGGVRIARGDGGAVPATGFADAGLPAEIDHPCARDILASPMAGRLDGHHDLADLPALLASALLGRASLNGLDERLLFGFDDGSGDVLAHSPDLATVATDSGDVLRIHVAGRDVGYLVSQSDAATVLADVAAGLAAGSEEPVRVPGSGRLHDLVVDVVGSHPLTSAAASSATGSPTSTTTAVEVPRVGWVDTSDGLVSLLAVTPHGLVPARLAEFLGAIERPSTISADRVIGLHELTEGMAEQVVRVLAPMGMVFDAESPWVTGSA